MTKQLTIKNLLVIPLIASAVLLASPALASNHMQTGQAEIRNITSKEETPNKKRGIVGSVISVHESIIVVEAKDNMEYTVDAGHATIMKAGTLPDTNPDIVDIDQIHVGDAVVVRGTIDDKEISASRILDGVMPVKKLKHAKKLKNVKRNVSRFTGIHKTK